MQPLDAVARSQQGRAKLREQLYVLVSHGEDLGRAPDLAGLSEDDQDDAVATFLAGEELATGYIGDLITETEIVQPLLSNSEGHYTRDSSASVGEFADLSAYFPGWLVYELYSPGDLIAPLEKWIPPSEAHTIGVEEFGYLDWSGVIDASPVLNSGFASLSEEGIVVEIPGATGGRLRCDDPLAPESSDFAILFPGDNIGPRLYKAAGNDSAMWDIATARIQVIGGRYEHDGAVTEQSVCFRVNAGDFAAKNIFTTGFARMTEVGMDSNAGRPKVLGYRAVLDVEIGCSGILHAQATSIEYQGKFNFQGTPAFPPISYIEINSRVSEMNAVLDSPQDLNNATLTVENMSEKIPTDDAQLIIPGYDEQILYEGLTRNPDGTGTFTGCTTAGDAPVMPAGTELWYKTNNDGGLWETISQYIPDGDKHRFGGARHAVYFDASRGQIVNHTWGKKSTSDHITGIGVMMVNDGGIGRFKHIDTTQMRLTCDRGADQGEPCGILLAYNSTKYFASNIRTGFGSLTTAGTRAQIVSSGNEIQQLEVDMAATDAPSDTYKLVCDIGGAQTTAVIRADEAPGDLRDIIEALSNVPARSIEVYGGVGSVDGVCPYWILFAGDLADTEIPLLTVTDSTLDGTVTVSKLVTGGTGDKLSGYDCIGSNMVDQNIPGGNPITRDAMITVAAQHAHFDLNTLAPSSSEDDDAEEDVVAHSNYFIREMVPVSDIRVTGNDVARGVLLGLIDVHPESDQASLGRVITGNDPPSLGDAKRSTKLDDQTLTQSDNTNLQAITGLRVPILPEEEIWVLLHVYLSATSVNADWKFGFGDDSTNVANARWWNGNPSAGVGGTPNAGKTLAATDSAGGAGPITDRHLLIIRGIFTGDSDPGFVQFSMCQNSSVAEDNIVRAGSYIERTRNRA